MKRRVLFIIGMMSALFATSCNETSDVVDRYVDVEISTAIESNYENLAESRAESGFEVGDSEYDMRYTIELWSGDYSKVVYRDEVFVANISENLIHSFRFIAGDYRLVIFADYVTAADKKSHYNTSNGLDEITISDKTYTANDASRDCFGYSEVLEITSSFTLSGITLKRPMARMTLADKTTANVESSKDVEITYSTSIPNGYDLLNREVITSEAVTASYPTTENGQAILAYDYIFASSDPITYPITFKVGDKEVSTPVTFEQNKTTNIKATFFDNQTN